MTTLLTFDDALASTYRKTAEVIAFPVDREVEFTLGGVQMGAGPRSATASTT